MCQACEWYRHSVVTMASFLRGLVCGAARAAHGAATNPVPNAVRNSRLLSIVSPCDAATRSIMRIPRPVASRFRSAVRLQAGGIASHGTETKNLNGHVVRENSVFGSRTYLHTGGLHQRFSETGHAAFPQRIRRMVYVTLIQRSAGARRIQDVSLAEKVLESSGCGPPRGQAALGVVDQLANLGFDFGAWSGNSRPEPPARIKYP